MHLRLYIISPNENTSYVNVLLSHCICTYFQPRLRYYIEGRASGFPLDKSPCRAFMNRRATTPRNSL
jgi:hypothetical protein